MLIDIPQSPTSNGTPSLASNQNHTYLPGSQENGLNTKDEDGRTPLHHAVLNRSLRQVEEYLSRGAAVNIRDNEGNQPLHIATTKAFEDIVRALLKNGADVNGKGEGGRTPLHITRSIKVVKLILKSYPVVSCHDDEGNTPLHLALSPSIPYGPTKSTIIKELIAAGADVNTPNNEGLTSFHSLLEHKNNYGTRYKNHLEFVQLFLENDGNVNKRAPSGDLPLKTFMDNDMAFWHNVDEFTLKVSLVKAFIERGASVNVRLQTGELLINRILTFRGVCTNSMSPNPELRELLCNNADLTISGLGGNYALHCIVNLLSSSLPEKERVVATIKIFLDHKADPNSRNNTGETPLILLAKKIQSGGYIWSRTEVAVAKLLLEAGVDPWLRDMENNLAIYFVARHAEFEKQKEMFELLLDPCHARNSFELVGRFEDERKDRYFWIQLFNFHQSTSWITPNSLKESANYMPEDVADIVLEMVLASIAGILLGLVKDRYEKDLSLYRKDHLSMRIQRREFIRILQDCRRLEINVDQSWFHVLLDIVDYWD
jgi:ankyrin repeat protein